jgi:hypothetical protein
MLPSPEPTRPAELNGLILPAMQANILRALDAAGTELIAKQIAARAGYQYNSRFRAVVRAMTLEGLLERGANGYRLTNFLRLGK